MGPFFNHKRVFYKNFVFYKELVGRAQVDSMN